MTNDLAIRILSGAILGTTEQTHEAVAMAIKALSALPSASDLIDRRAAIGSAMKDVSDKRTHDFNAGATRAANRIKLLPSVQPEQQWIPVTARCPEIGQIVLCLLKTRHYYGRIHVCKYCAADKYYDHPYFDWGHNGFPDVVAWMPLPEPYKGGEQNG